MMEDRAVRKRVRRERGGWEREKEVERGRRGSREKEGKESSSLLPLSLGFAGRPAKQALNS